MSKSDNRKIRAEKLLKLTRHPEWGTYLQMLKEAKEGKEKDLRNVKTSKPNCMLDIMEIRGMCKAFEWATLKVGWEIDEALNKEKE